MANVLQQKRWRSVFATLGFSGTLMEAALRRVSTISNPNFWRSEKSDLKAKSSAVKGYP